MSRLFLLGFLLVVASPTLAEPNRTMHLLMGESISRLEWGLFQIERAVERFQPPQLTFIAPPRASATYDPASDRIHIEIQVYRQVSTYNQGLQSGSQKLCKEVLDGVKKTFGYGIVRENRQEISISTLFKSRDARDQTTSNESFMDDIEAITELQVHLNTGKTAGGGMIYSGSCASGLLEDEITYSRQQEDAG